MYSCIFCQAATTNPLGFCSSECERAHEEAVADTIWWNDDDEVICLVCGPDLCADCQREHHELSHAILPIKELMEMEIEPPF